MVREYDPSWEMVAVLLKTHDRTNTYRVGVVSRKPRQQTRNPYSMMASSLVLVTISPPSSTHQKVWLSEVRSTFRQSP